MTVRERFRAVLSGGLPDDRLPVIEWAPWWDLTAKRWEKEGFQPGAEWYDTFRQFGLDGHRQYWFSHTAPDCPQPAYFGAPLMENESDYERLKPYLYPENGNEWAFSSMKAHAAEHARGDFALWFSLDGGFWFPRRLFGIEGHLFSFYDEPALYHRILDDLADYQLRLIERVYAIDTPEFMTFGEDMSYNLGPMISEELFHEFLLPYYRRVIPAIRAHGTKVLVDSDGDITMMVPWLKRAGIQGVLPLEHQAGTDLARIRREHPDFLMIGAFDKMVMKHGEAAMRAEFERLLPVMRQGGFIPSVDHQTPPDVSLENYRIYVRLLREYAEKAVSGRK